MTPMIREKTSIIAHLATAHYRAVDIEIALLAMAPNMRIGGSEDAKGYGGFSARIKLSDTMNFTGPTGDLIPQNLPVEGGGWLDISGPVGEKNQTIGLTVLSHPANPGYPNPWILRAKISMQNAVYPHPGKEAIPISDTSALKLRYRLLIHNGEATSLSINSLHADFVSE